MMLILLLLTPFISALVSFMGPRNELAQRVISLVALGVSLGFAFAIKTSQSAGQWLIDWRMPWVPSWGIELHFGLDTLSWWLVILTLIVGMIASLYTQQQPEGSGITPILWTVFALVGLFSALDTFLFFIFWELSLLPMYWVILRVTKESRTALQYIIYTQLSGLLLLCSIVGLVICHYRITGTLTFDYEQLRQSAQFFDMQPYLFFGFLLAFLLKLPSLPFHGWLVNIFTHAPAQMVVIAVLIKTSIFGLLRFAWPFFPQSSATYAVPIMVLGVCALLYGAVLAFAQKEPRQFIAYSTLSHAGLLLVGVFAGNQPSSLGVIMLLVCQALSTGGILLLVNTFAIKDLSYNHGLWSKQPLSAVLLLMLVLAGLGFPGYGNFVGEWLLLFGTFGAHSTLAIFVGLGMILSAVYSLWFFQKLCWGTPTQDATASPSLRQTIALYATVLALLSIGLFPRVLISPLETMSPSNGLDASLSSTTSSMKGMMP